ncbi:MAG: S1 RNA-binding domain-containing protein [Candidatus Aenigmarchaeota archaeon]|nr:S1 RNA-binding domain-containing protein [Candidatus Aenigmarchaeota archaeon]
MVRRRGMPTQGELVVCTITKVNPNSAFAKLDEYDNKEGMIHISEVSSGWVKDIRNHVRTGQQFIAKITRLENNNISLSIKKVDKNQENFKMKEYRLSQRAEKLLEIAAKQIGKDLPKAYEEVGYLLQEAFGSLYEGFKAALTPGALEKKGIPEKWIPMIKELAEKNIEQKEFEFRAKIFINSTKSDGIDVIKSILAEAQKNGLQVHYIAAPEYLVKMKTKNAKKGEKEFNSALESIEKSGKGRAEVRVEVVR